ncbi:MAG: stage II sporulation protein M [Halobacteriales archaeon]
MLETVVSVFGRVEVLPFVVSALLFALGYVVSYPVVVYDISLLTWYPLLVWRRVRALVSPDDPWHRLFVFLFVFNSFSLLLNFVGGILVVLPPVFALFLGLNVGVIAVEEGGVAGLAVTVVNPVAWLELPAAWISLAIGFQLARTVVSQGPVISVFAELAHVYVFVVLPLLLAAALLEATLIRAVGVTQSDARSTR